MLLGTFNDIYGREVPAGSPSGKHAASTLQLQRCCIDLVDTALVLCSIWLLQLCCPPAICGIMQGLDTLPFKELFLAFFALVTLWHLYLDIRQLYAIRKPSPPKELAGLFKDQEVCAFGSCLCLSLSCLERM